MRQPDWTDRIVAVVLLVFMFAVVIGTTVISQERRARAQGRLQTAEALPVTPIQYPQEYDVDLEVEPLCVGHFCEGPSSYRIKGHVRVVR